MGMLNKSEYVKWKMGDKVKPRTKCGPGKTKQEFAQEADINAIMARYHKTGELPRSSRAELMVYADVSEVGSYADMVRRVEAGGAAFNSLPPAVRARFQNDPAELFSFLGDEKNREEAVALGLIPKKEPVAPAAAPAAPPALPAGGEAPKV